jgi:5-methylcytosine-specific restriction endonuclease McrA
MSGLYGYRWQVGSKRFLAAHPLCIMCQRQGRTTAATIVDHIVRHKGNVTLFWDEANWQPLCKQHHDRTKHGGRGKHNESKHLDRRGSEALTNPDVFG